MRGFYKGLVPNVLRWDPQQKSSQVLPVWITVSNWQALVIQKVDNAIHCINHYPVNNAVGIHNTYPHWIVIYPVDYAIEHLINRGQNCNVDVADKRTTALVLFNSKLGLHTWKISAVINATVREKSKKQKTKTRTNPEGSIRGRLLVQSWAYCYPPSPCYVWLVKQNSR